MLKQYETNFSHNGCVCAPVTPHFDLYEGGQHGFCPNFEPYKHRAWVCWRRSPSQATNGRVAGYETYQQCIGVELGLVISLLLPFIKAQVPCVYLKDICWSQQRLEFSFGLFLYQMPQQVQGFKRTCCLWKKEPSFTFLLLDCCRLSQVKPSQRLFMKHI